MALDAKLTLTSANNGLVTLQPYPGTIGATTLYLPSGSGNILSAGVLASPPPIGNNTPNTGAFTNLTTSGTLTLSGSLRDSSGSTGTSGQILGSTGNGTQWIASGTSTGTITANGTPAFVGNNGGLFLGNSFYGIGFGGTVASSTSSIKGAFVGNNMSITCTTRPIDIVAATDSNAIVYFYNGANNVAYIAEDGTYSSISDENVKTNIRPLEYGLAEIKQLQPISYNVILNGQISDKVSLGLPAQNVQQVIPEAVTDMNGTLSVADYPILAVLVKSIQELSDEVESLKAKLAP